MAWGLSSDMLGDNGHTAGAYAAPPEAVVRAARRVVAAVARDVAECRDLLGALGLLPAQLEELRERGERERG